MVEWTLIAEFSMELLALAFHLSILACILVQLRRNTAVFRKRFFVIYAVQSATEVFAIVWVRFVVTCRSLRLGSKWICSAVSVLVTDVLSRTYALNPAVSRGTVRCAPTPSARELLLCRTVRRFGSYQFRCSVQFELYCS